LAFATFLVWRLRTGACGVGACGFWRYRMPPNPNSENFRIEKSKLFSDALPKIGDFIIFNVCLAQVFERAEKINL